MGVTEFGMLARQSGESKNQTKLMGISFVHKTHSLTFQFISRERETRERHINYFACQNQAEFLPTAHVDSDFRAIVTWQSLIGRHGLEPKPVSKPADGEFEYMVIPTLIIQKKNGGMGRRVIFPPPLSSASNLVCHASDKIVVAGFIRKT